MQIKNQIPLIRKTLYGIMLLALFLFTLGSVHVSSAKAQEGALPGTEPVLSDGQFVYGPNVGDFSIQDYIKSNAPHLLKYADALYERSEYYSINPKVYLTLLEMHSRLISTPDTAAMENPFGLKSGDFVSQIEQLSNIMTEAYYAHLLSYTPLPVSERQLTPFVTPSGGSIEVADPRRAGAHQSGP